MNSKIQAKSNSFQSAPPIQKLDNHNKHRRTFYLSELKYCKTPYTSHDSNKQNLSGLFARDQDRNNVNNIRIKVGVYMFSSVNIFYFFLNL